MLDDELAKIAYEAWNTSGVPWESHIISGNAFRSAKWITIARAVRAALLPEVTPLRPGETVMIPDRWWLPTDTVYAGLTLNESECYPDLSVIADDGEVGIRVRLDAAGVATLIETCRRWLAAQEGHKCPYNERKALT